MDLYTNDQVRAAFAAANITTENMSDGMLKSLHKKLSETLSKSECFNGTFRMNDLVDKKFMTCRADYFEDREAVSFNRDGFIGFAGWSSSKNSQPILQGVMAWLTEFTEQRNAILDKYI